MNWYIASILAFFSYSCANALVKFASFHLSPFSGALLQAIGALLIALPIFFISQSAGLLASPDRVSVVAAIISGGLWVVGQIFLFFALAKNAPISIVLPFIVGGIGVGGVLAGVIFYKETLTIIQIFGIITVLIGSVMLAK